jgi:hypothetical protein
VISACNSVEKTLILGESMRNENKRNKEQTIHNDPLIASWPIQKQPVGQVSHTGLQLIVLCKGLQSNSSQVKIGFSSRENLYAS